VKGAGRFDGAWESFVAWLGSADHRNPLE
jgi:hypothetical protein